MVVLAATLWGTLGVFARFLNQKGYTGFEVASLRIVLSGLIFLIFIPFIWNNLLQIKSIKIYIFQSFFGVFLYNTLYFLAISRIGITCSVALLYTSPIWTLILSKLFIKNTISILQIFISLICFLSVYIVIGTKFNETHIDLLGLFSGLGSGAAYATYYVIGKKIIEHEKPNVVIFFSFIIGAFLFLMIPNSWGLLIKITEERQGLVWIYFIFITIIGTIVSYFIFVHGLNKISAPTVSILTTVEPIVGVSLASLIFNEPLSLVQISGFCLILGANVINGLFLDRS